MRQSDWVVFFFTICLIGGASFAYLRVEHPPLAVYDLTPVYKPGSESQSIFSKIIDVLSPSTPASSQPVVALEHPAQSSRPVTNTPPSVSSSPASGATPVSPPPLAASCSSIPTSASVGDSVTWTVTTSGGTLPYTYTWSGTDALSGSGPKLAISYSTAGTKTASVVVTSGGQSISVFCASPATISTALYPDLIAHTPSVQNGVLQEGQAITFTADVENSGNAPVAGTFQDVFQIDLNNDGVFDESVNATLAGTSLTDLAVRQSKSVSSIAWTAVAGTHRIRLCTDLPVSAIPEANEDNNCTAVASSFLFTVTPAPDIATPVVSLATIPPSVSPPYMMVDGGPLKRSDVLFSVRFGGRQANEASWLASAAGFFANRFVWVYDPTEDFNKKTSEAGYPIEASVPFYLQQLSVDLGISFDANTIDLMQCADIQGNSTLLSFEAGAVAAGSYSKSVTRPDVNSEIFRQYQLADLEKSVDKGYTMFHQDNPALNAELVATGGCFSDDGMKKFNQYLQSHLTPSSLASIGIPDIDSFNYKTYLLKKGAPGGAAFVNWSDPIKPYYVAFQNQSVEEYDDWLHTSLREYARKKNPSVQLLFSANLFVLNLQTYPWLAKHFDFGIAELFPKSVADFVSYAQMVNTNGAVNAVTLSRGDLWQNKLFMATAYATGLTAIAPWDQFAGTSASRFFGNPADFAPTFSLVRNNQALFDNYTAYKEYAMPTSYVVTQVNPGPLLYGVSWEGSHTFPNIQLHSTVAIGRRIFQTVSASAGGFIYLSPTTTPISLGDPVWYIQNPDGSLLYNQSEYNAVPAGAQMTSSFVTSTVATTTAPARIIAYWNNQQGLKNIPFGSTVAIGDQVYTTVAATAVGVLYLPPDAAVNPSDPIWYIQNPQGMMLYNGAGQIAVTVRRNGNNAVMHVLNWLGTPLHIMVRIPKSDILNPPDSLITPENQTRRTAPHQDVGQYTVYDMGTVDIWAMAYNSSLSEEKQKRNLASVLTGIVPSFLRAIEEWFLRLLQALV